MFQATPTLAAAALLLLLQVQAASAQLIGAAGDERHLWLVRQATDGRFDLLHRTVGDPVGSMRHAGTMRGQLARAGWATGRGRLWLVYDNLTVHLVRAIPPDPSQRAGPDVSAGGWRFNMLVHAAPPPGIVLRSLAANDAGLWALVQVQTAEAQTAIDRGHPERARAPTELDAHASATDADAPDVDSADTTGERTDVRLSTGQPRLIHLDRNRWVNVPLPIGWPAEARAWVVSLDDASSHPHLVVQAPDTADPADDAVRLWVYRHVGEDRTATDVDEHGWRRQTYTLERLADADAPAGGELVPLAVASQLVVGQVAMRQAPGDGSPTIEATLTVLRRGRTSTLGQLVLQDPPGDTWALTAFGQSAALIAAGDAGYPAWSRMDLHGRLVERNIELVRVHPDPLAPMADSLILIIVLVVATFIMLVFWRRDPAWNQVELPDDAALARLIPRALAGLIDLLPAMFIASLIFSVPMTQFASHWPGSSGGFDAMRPGLLAIGILVLHTTVTELFTARTLGKMIMGLRVTGLRGQPPNIWQVIARNALKGLELIALPLLILPLIGPNRQRLGDLVGRTVVVAVERGNHE